MRQRIFKSARPIVKLGKEYAVNPVVRTMTGFVPISERSENDIFVVGYPKSGNTWFQNLVSGVVYGINPLYAPDTLIQELVPDIHHKRFYKRYWTPMFFKSHLLPQPDYRKVVYLLRDGRDAMVSYFHFLAALNGYEPDFAEMVRAGVGLFCKWHTHVEAWLSNPYGAEILTIRYEDMKSNCVRELQRFCEFAAVERDLSWLEQVAENAAFERMYDKEKTGRYFMDNPAWPKDRMFSRRGIAGSHEDEMPPEVMALFLQDAGETLQRCGYL
jgi:hypothetical protein